MHAESSLTLSPLLIIHSVMSTSAQWAQRSLILKLFAFPLFAAVSEI